MTSKKALERYYSNLKYGCGGFQNDDEELEALMIIKQDLDRLEKVEKELNQTKSNFKNSQTHYKKCYKNLKNDMNRLIKIIKDYSFITNYDMAWGVNCEDEDFLRKILK